MAEDGRLIKHSHKEYPELKNVAVNSPVSIHARGIVQRVNKDDETAVLYDVFDVQTEKAVDKELKKMEGKQGANKDFVSDDDSF